VLADDVRMHALRVDAHNGRRAAPATAPCPGLCRSPPRGFGSSPKALVRMCQRIYRFVAISRIPFGFVATILGITSRKIAAFFFNRSRRVSPERGRHPT